MALVKDTTKLLKLMYHQTFEIKEKGKTTMRHTLLVNPEDMSMEEPSRVNVVQTLGGAYVTDFGQGLPTVTISGITGYKARYSVEGNYVDGFEEFMLFRGSVYRNFLEANSADMELHWYNWEDNEHYQIQPTGFRLSRNARQPLLYRYEFRFVCLRKRGSPHKIYDKILNDPRFRLIDAFLNDGISGLGKSILSMGLSGQLNKLSGTSMTTLKGSIGKEVNKSLGKLRGLGRKIF
jgi:hypothetical protein